MSTAAGKKHASAIYPSCFLQPAPRHEFLTLPSQRLLASLRCYEIDDQGADKGINKTLFSAH